VENQGVIVLDRDLEKLAYKLKSGVIVSDWDLGKIPLKWKIRTLLCQTGIWKKLCLNTKLGRYCVRSGFREN
jgi:hypothetical protein